ncbi:PREDICTED: protocadherin gamma-B1-like [Nanorana parkeri]|uniref:protocadherin gamma-B1-like n=1 Tax=Nanorana parkeri TaxID=125878 RepID=UPI000854F415|nr:PREDICTED: protocadherin gamma-B1-like [Nanorana parkeri]
MKRTEIKKQIQTYKGFRWQVIFSFLISCLCHSVSGQIHYSIVEEMRKDSFIANIADDLELDINSLSSRKMRIGSRVADKYFYVNGDNGNLYVKDRIDRETLCEAEATCFLTFDVVVQNPLNIFRVTIDIQDINDNPPVFYLDSFTFEAIESIPPGTTFALQNAKDPDFGINSVQIYKLSDNKHFALSEKINSDGSTFLELVLEKPLDREYQNVHEFLLSATDGGKPMRSATALVKIIVTDANDNFPVFTQTVYKASTSENMPINTSIITVTASDKDEGINAQINYSFIETSGSVHHTGTFCINPKTGDIKIYKKLDFELTKHYELSVQAKDGGALTAHCKVLIDIIDENDNAPEISITSLFSPVSEDSTPGTVIAVIEVEDQDSGENRYIDCKLMKQPLFSLVMSSDNYYRIVTTGELDREKVSSYDITIVATDRGSSPLSSRKTIRLNISDVNDNPPVFMTSSFIVNILENNLQGVSVYNIQASDPDAAENAKITYSICNIDAEHFTASYISINMETGVLYAQKTFDFEQHKDFLIEVIATDNGSPSLSTNTTLLINIVDQNDNAPRILFPSPGSGGHDPFEMVPFTAEPGSLITKVVAVDEDSGHNAWLSYHFMQLSESSVFVINKNTGEIRTSHIFQEKDMLNQKVVVMVRDNGIPPLSATVTLSLIVADSFQQIVPKLSNQLTNDDHQSHLQWYLVVSLALISFLFIITVILVIVSKCKEPKPLPNFGTLTSSLYPPADPRILSMYSEGTLPLPYSYNVCVALDPSESDFGLVNSNQNIPVDNLIDTDYSGLENESFKEILPSTGVSTTPPGRPIISSIESLTSGLSRYVDSFLQPIVTTLPSYLRDSGHLIEALRPYSWEPSYHWVSLDICSRYTSIPHEVGLQALQPYLSQQTDVHYKQAQFILNSTKFTLEHNYFTFLDNFYLQIQGTAMGANYAPSYANLTMGLWEEFHIWHLIFFGRYINYILIIWDGPPDTIQDFVAHCNTNPSGLSFTHVTDQRSLVFLDLELTHSEGKIITKTHFKPTAGNSYLHFKSCHHPLWKRNVPKGQFCRISKNCTNKEDYVQQSHILKSKFLEKGYPKHLITKAQDQFIKMVPKPSPKKPVEEHPKKQPASLPHSITVTRPLKPSSTPPAARAATPALQASPANACRSQLRQTVRKPRLLNTLSLRRLHRSPVPPSWTPRRSTSSQHLPSEDTCASNRPEDHPTAHRPGTTLAAPSSLRVALQYPHVQAKDGGALAAHSKVLIEVIDKNDNAPEISITSLFSPVPEDSIPGTVTALIEVDDHDSGENRNIDCKLIEQHLFNLLFSSDSYYRIVTIDDMDRERASSHNITVVATDKGSPPLSNRRTIKLDISDVNDNPPVFIKYTYAVYIPQNYFPGVSIYSVQASHHDAGDNAKLIYSIFSINAEDFPMSSYLSSNMETGALYAQKSFDFEQHKEFLVQVIATDKGSPSLSSYTTLVIPIVDVNDNAPKILFPSAQIDEQDPFEMVVFTAEPGSLITKVVAVDEDSGHNAWLSYHFIHI